MHTYINQLAEFAGTSTTIKGWVANKRTSKGLVFLVVRDGSGYCQCVVNQQDVDEAAFEGADKATMESAVAVSSGTALDPWRSWAMLVSRD